MLKFLKTAELGAKFAITALTVIIVLQAVTIWLLIDSGSPHCAT